MAGIIYAWLFSIRVYQKKVEGVGPMLKKRNCRGYTLIELLIVVAIIGVLAAIALPLYKIHTVKAKISEVVNAMHYVSQAVGLYAQEAGAGGGVPSYPNCPDLPTIQSSLGVSLGAIRISDGSVDSVTGTITMTLSGIDPAVDTRTITLEPLADPDGSINWRWGGTVAAGYIPKK
jgi:type IV pilus assembly protein PilA